MADGNLIQTSVRCCKWESNVRAKHAVTGMILTSVNVQRDLGVQVLDFLKLATQ